jgi:hypothetical protein
VIPWLESLRSSSRGRLTAVCGSASSLLFFVRLRLRVSFFPAADLLAGGESALSSSSSFDEGAGERAKICGVRSRLTWWLPIWSWEGEMVGAASVLPRADSIQLPNTKWSSTSMRGPSGEDPPEQLFEGETQEEGEEMGEQPDPGEEEKEKEEGGDEAGDDEEEEEADSDGTDVKSSKRCVESNGRISWL